MRVDLNAINKMKNQMGTQGPESEEDVMLH